MIRSQGPSSSTTRSGRGSDVVHRAAAVLSPPPFGLGNGGKPRGRATAGFCCVWAQTYNVLPTGLSSTDELLNFFESDTYFTVLLHQYVATRRQWWEGIYIGGLVILGWAGCGLGTSWNYFIS